jgi:hypothetical protein
MITGTGNNKYTIWYASQPHITLLRYSSTGTGLFYKRFPLIMVWDKTFASIILTLLLKFTGMGDEFTSTNLTSASFIVNYAVSKVPLTVGSVRVLKTTRSLLLKTLTFSKILKVIFLKR